MKNGYLISDKLIDIGLILFFGGFGFACYINGVCGIGKDYMQRNKIDLVRWMFSPRHILRSNTPFDSNEPLELKFKEPKSKHMIYNFHHPLCNNHAVFSDLCGDFSILRGASY